MDTNSDWSKLCPDTLRKIFETLKSSVDSHRAKTVCSYWYAVWKTCANKPPCPWQIIHKGDYSTIKEGTKPHAGLSNESYCLASCRNWLLMVDRPLKFHILNFVTQEKIDLSSMEFPIRGKQVRFKPRNEDYGRFVEPSLMDKVFYTVSYDNEWKSSAAVLWINETTKDFVVAWTLRQHYLFLLKKGDSSWYNLDIIKKYLGFGDVVPHRRNFMRKLNNGKSILGVFNMACDTSKLYLFTYDNNIKIIDFSGEIPEEVITENPYRNHPFDFVEKEWEFIWKRKIAIRKSGEVLIILSLKEVLYEDRLLFYIFKMNLESFKWERVYSIGDEMVVFGQGVTVALPLSDGSIKNDSIYFVDDDVWPDHQDHDHRVSDCGVFDIATSRIKWPKKICFKLNFTQWFVPGVAY